MYTCAWRRIQRPARILNTLHGCWLIDIVADYGHIGGVEAVVWNLHASNNVAGVAHVGRGRAVVAVVRPEPAVAVPRHAVRVVAARTATWQLGAWNGPARTRAVQNAYRTCCVVLDCA